MNNSLKKCVWKYFLQNISHLFMTWCGWRLGIYFPGTGYLQYVNGPFNLFFSSVWISGTMCCMLSTFNVWSRIVAIINESFFPCSYSQLFFRPYSRKHCNKLLFLSVDLSFKILLFHVAFLLFCAILIINAPRNTGVDVMFLYRFVCHRSCLPQPLCPRDNFWATFWISSFLAQLLALTYKLPD